MATPQTHQTTFQPYHPGTQSFYSPQQQPQGQYVTTPMNLTHMSQVGPQVPIPPPAPTTPVYYCPQCGCTANRKTVQQGGNRGRLYLQCPNDACKTTNENTQKTNYKFIGWEDELAKKTPSVFVPKTQQQQQPNMTTTRTATDGLDLSQVIQRLCNLEAGGFHNHEAVISLLTQINDGINRTHALLEILGKKNQILNTNNNSNGSI